MLIKATANGKDYFITVQVVEVTLTVPPPVIFNNQTAVPTFSCGNAIDSMGRSTLSTGPMCPRFASGKRREYRRAALLGRRGGGPPASRLFAAPPPLLQKFLPARLFLCIFFKISMK